MGSTIVSRSGDNRTPIRRTGSTRLVKVRIVAMYTPTCESVLLFDRRAGMSAMWSGPTRLGAPPVPSAGGMSSEMRTMRSECANGSGRRRMAWRTLKMAVVAPMPSAKVRSATTLKPGVLTNIRNA